MAKVWTRIMMALIFVFATVSSPLHAQAIPAEHRDMASSHATPVVAMDGMNADCAKAMASTTHKTEPAHKAPAPSGGCCSNGCNCPLSHCPATPPVLVSDVVTFLPVSASLWIGKSGDVPTSNPSDKLKRPPRA